MTPVTVQFYKPWGELHWRHDMLMLGEDRHGVWLAGPAGTIVQRGREPARPWPYPFVQLIPAGAWWTLLFNGDFSGRYRQYVDIIEPAEWVGSDRVEMIDFDLDVVETTGGDFEILDGDEFERHSRIHRYPAPKIEAARQTAGEVMRAMRDGEEPFSQAGRSWLEEMLNEA